MANDTKIEFSLDCELLWGMAPGVGSHYIKHNVGNAQKSLFRIIESWDGCSSLLSLAFVSKSLDDVEINPVDVLGLENAGYSDFIGDKYLKYPSSTIEELVAINNNFVLGIHSYSHKLYTDLTNDELIDEVDNVLNFVSVKPQYKGIFVYPKNLADLYSLNVYLGAFTSVRVNSKSWLYRSNKEGVSKIRRVLRYMDSFVPIFELCCNKSPEIKGDNIIVGTHFFRANLSPFLLYIHYFRLCLGREVMRFMGYKMHVWSHPHNFANNQLAISLFRKLAG